MELILYFNLKLLKLLNAVYSLFLNIREGLQRLSLVQLAKYTIS